MRDDQWLNQRLEQIWQFLFPELIKGNKVIIRFKGKWKNKFGHISKRGEHSEIVINGLFRHDDVPEYMIDLTIAHELIHYMHGFNSPLPKLYKHPHKGGIVTRELRKRGFSHLLIREKYFLKDKWGYLYKQLANA
ncbi:hypothetical protein HY500_04430 [Candidatus Woesearchaeota archaeon]|nr:hypothetical protein [Candidatus Woesearchaeota archaeon]